MVLKKFNITQSVFSIARKGNILSLPIFSGIVHIPSVIAREVRPKQSRKPAFSLIEMLMALLVASLLLAALAPVITRRMNESLTVNSNINFSDGETIVKELTFGMNEQTAVCTETGYEYDSKGNITGEYCEGTFVVPNDVHQLKVIAIGAGGGGGTAPTAGYTEYTTAGSTNSFTVPAMVNKLEATTIGAGIGGGAGGQIFKTQTFVTSGNGGVVQNSNNKLTVLSNATSTWTIPEVARGKNVLVTGCGGGGGAGGGFKNNIAKGGNGGFGNYIQNKAVLFANGQTTANIFIGGGGGGGGGDDTGTAGAGRPYGGGSGGHEIGTAARINGSAPGGAGGYSAYNTATGQLFATGGGGDNGVGGNGSIALNDWRGGGGSIGESGGTGGGTNSDWLNRLVANNGASIAGGAGGGSEGGGGGGAGSSGNGGGGGGATLIKQNGIELFNAGGGGGAGGIGAQNVTNSPDAIWSGGGGGGGVGGGKGGGGNYTTLNGGNGKSGKIATIWGGAYCAGGDNTNNNTINGFNGNDGALTIKYLSYGTGGSGGGGGRIHANYPLNNLVPNEELIVKIGTGGEGGKPGYINTSGTEIKPAEPVTNIDNSTYIQRKSNNIKLIEENPCGGGAWPGNSSGIACGPHVSPYSSEGGWIYSILGNVWPINGGMSGTNYPKGFFSTNGHPAGDSANLNCNASSIAIETSGGRGATSTTPWYGTCTPGKGGTKDSPAGGDASGYGCGGGGGYGLSNGGKGSGGYARLSWNMFWDTATEAYKRAENGTGGGGASGNTIISGLDVIPGDVIRFRIGKGGAGAFVSNNTVTGAKSGGITVFGCSGNNNTCTGGIRAGGGGGGGSTTINGANELINGIAGAISSECKAGGRNYINNTSVCSKGTIGKVSADKITGGEGAAYIIPASLSQYSKKLGAEALKGAGGKGGIQDTGENANGKPASGIASGGGGAAIRYSTTAILNGSETSNPISGGAGSDGKIILEWIKK